MSPGSANVGTRCRGVGGSQGKRAPEAPLTEPGRRSPKSCPVSVWKLLLATKPHLSASPFCWKTVGGTRGEPCVSRWDKVGKTAMGPAGVSLVRTQPFRLMFMNLVKRGAWGKTFAPPVCCVHDWILARECVSTEKGGGLSETRAPYAYVLK